MLSRHPDISNIACLFWKMCQISKYVWADKYLVHRLFSTPQVETSGSGPDGLSYKQDQPNGEHGSHGSKFHLQ